MEIRDTGKKIDLLGPKARRRGFQGSENDWDKEIKGRGLSPRSQEAIDKLPRVETKSAANSELLAQLHEANVERKKGNRFPDQEIIRRNAIQRKGRMIDHLGFLNTLREHGVRCWYNEVPFQGLIGLRAIRRGYEQLGLQYVCAVKIGLTTEYDFFHYDRHGVELNRKYVGWRSVLIHLISKGIISEYEAHKWFGRPQLCEASVLYRRALWQMRNERAIA
jgi:hypothetical protein